MQYETPPVSTLRCERCGDVIGVYEPLVYVSNGCVTETSRAAEPDLSFAGRECCHARCFEGPARLGSNPQRIRMPSTMAG